MLLNNILFRIRFNIKPSKSDLADIPARLLKDGSGATARPLTVLMNKVPR